MGKFGKKKRLEIIATGEKELSHQLKKQTKNANFKFGSKCAVVYAFKSNTSQIESCTVHCTFTPLCIAMQSAF